MTRFMASDGLRLFLAGEFTDVDFFHGCFQRMNFQRLRNTLFFPFFVCRLICGQDCRKLRAGLIPFCRLPDCREKAFRFEGWLTGESGAVEWFHAVFLLSESLSIYAPRNP